MTIGRRAVEALGADHTQWRALSGAMLKNDLRSGWAMDMLVSSGNKGARVPWFLIIMYGLYGVGVAIVSVAIPALFLASLLTLSMVGMFVAMAVILDFQSVVISPNDYPILAHQPVSSRTYFTAKLTTVLLYVGAIGALAGGPATLTYLLKYGPLVAAAWVAALAGAIVWIALAMIFIYAAILHLVRPDRLRRVLSYVQIVFITVVFAMPFVFLELTDARDWLGAIEIDQWPAAILLPPGWFASLLPLAAGNWSVTGVLAVLTAVLTTAALIRYGGRRLSLSYAERLGALVAVSEAKSRRRTRPRGPGKGWFSPELRVIMALVRAQFRHDMKFRMGVLAMLPFTVFYIFIALREGPLPDPFVESGFGPAGLGPIHFAVFFMPPMLLMELFRSDSFRASWVFFSAPVELTKLITRTGLCVTVFFVLPYLVVVAAIFVWAFENVWHALGHATFLGLLSHIGMQFLLLRMPRPPFSQPPSLAQTSRGFFGVFFFLSWMTATVILPLVIWVVYAEPARTIAAIALLAGVSVVLPAVVARRIRPRVRQLEFGG